MNIKLYTYLLSLVFLLGLSALVMAQDQNVTPKPVSYVTPSKLVIAKLKNGDQEVFEVRGKATFTIVAANSDDTIAGTLIYTIPDDARQKIASMSSKPVGSIPSSITKKDVVAGFQKGTGMPMIHLEINPFDSDVQGVKMAFTRIVLDIPGREAGNLTPYTREEMERLITVWAQQIAANRQRRGPISRLNKIINGEPQ